MVSGDDSDRTNPISKILALPLVVFMVLLCLPSSRFSVSNDLKYDAERDLRDIGAKNILVHSLNKVRKFFCLLCPVEAKALCVERLRSVCGTSLEVLKPIMLPSSLNYCAGVHALHVACKSSCQSAVMVLVCSCMIYIGSVGVEFGFHKKRV